MYGTEYGTAGKLTPFRVVFFVENGSENGRFSAVPFSVLYFLHGIRYGGGAMSKQQLVPSFSSCSLGKEQKQLFY